MTLVLFALLASLAVRLLKFAMAGPRMMFMKIL